MLSGSLVVGKPPALICDFKNKSTKTCKDTDFICQVHSCSVIHICPDFEASNTSQGKVVTMSVKYSETKCNKMRYVCTQKISDLLFNFKIQANFCKTNKEKP